MNELQGRVALVTGSVRNIGKAIALGLSAEGAAVVLNSRTESPAGREMVAAIAAKGGKAIYCVADVSAESGVERLVGEAKKAFGAVDILVNNAGIRRLAPIEKLSLAEWREVMGANLDSAFLCARACIPLMTTGRGRIVNIGGLSAHRGAGQRAHVVTSKAGMIGLTKALAIELAERGITSNCVAPALPPHPQGFDSPLGRKGMPEEIAAMVVYLAGDAGAYVTGQTIHVNGGLYLP